MYDYKNKQPRKFINKLNLHEPIVVQLSEKHNLTPKTVAYIRAAIIGEHARYDKNTLIDHIAFDNEQRRKAIEEHKISEILNEQEKADLIKFTTVNIEFRESVAEFLRTVSDEVFNDLLSKTMQPIPRKVHY